MNLFNQYHTYTKRMEPPQRYQIWTCISTISTLLGKKCFFPMGHFTIFPHMYIMLVGKPSMRKSTALRESINFLRPRRINLFEGSITREQMIEDFVDLRARVKFKLEGKECFYQQLSINVGEFNEFIGGKHINDSMVRFLTDMWDAKKISYRTKNKGKYEGENPFLTILGACTLEWLVENLKGGVITNGFSRRVLFVYSERKNCRRARPSLGFEELEARTNLHKEFERIQQIQGEFVFTKEADELYEKFYTELEDQENNSPTLMQYYYATKGELVIKLAMCLSAAYNSNRVIDSGMLSLALDLLAELEVDLPRVLGGLGRNDLKAYADQILEFIQDSEKVALSQIIDRFYGDLSDQELQEILKVLEATRKVTKALPKGGVDFLYSANARLAQQQEVNLFEALGQFQPSNEQSLADVQAVDLGVLFGSGPEPLKTSAKAGLAARLRGDHNSGTLLEQL